MRLFSTTFFSHNIDVSKRRSPFQSQTLQGIALGSSDISYGLEIYNHISNQIYTSTVLKIDEINETKSLFNLKYVGGIF